MALHHDPRRHADGALDIGHYRRRARRLRAMARRQVWRATLRCLAALASRALGGRATDRGAH